MKLLLSIIFASSIGLSFAQSKEDFVAEVPLDSVMQYEGSGTLAIGNCLVLKFSGDAKQFINELVFLHAQDEKKIERTQSTLAIYETTKPYWVYGTYSVFANMWAADNYTYIEIYFKAYSNPDNYKMYGARDEYQKLVKKVLGK